MIPLFALIPVLEGGLSAFSSNYVNSVLTEHGLRYNLEEGIDGLQNGVMNLQFSVDAISSGVSHQATMLSSIQSSIGAVGAMSTIGCALSAVNVYQLIKISKSIEKIETKIDDGFLDLKIYFEKQLKNLLEEQQKQRLSQAYNYYIKGLERLKTSLLINNISNRNSSLGSCISIFTESLSIYDNKSEYQNINIPAKLRRLECCWALESAIAETYFLQEEYDASLHSYNNIIQRIYSESKGILSHIDDSDYKFVLNDLNWIFQNDIQLIKSKVELINGYKKNKVFYPVTMKLINTESSKKDFDNISISPTKLYLECLITPNYGVDIRETVIESKHQLSDLKYQYIDFKSLPLIHICDLYVSLQHDKKNSNESTNEVISDKKSGNENINKILKKTMKLFWKKQ